MVQSRSGRTLSHLSADPVSESLATDEQHYSTVVSALCRLQSALDRRLSTLGAHGSRPGSVHIDSARRLGGIPQSAGCVILFGSGGAAAESGDVGSLYTHTGLGLPRWTGRCRRLVLPGLTFQSHL